MRRALAAGLVALMLVFVAGCGQISSNSSSLNGKPAQTDTVGQYAIGKHSQKIRLAKTKFALHAGLAFGAFHRYIYLPYKRGQFSGGLLHHKKAVLKGALAAAFAYHETKLALNDARSSAVLSKLLSPLLALQTKLSSLRTGLRQGKVDPAQITQTQSDASSVSSQSDKAGQPIRDQPTPSLGG